MCCVCVCAQVLLTCSSHQQGTLGSCCVCIRMHAHTCAHACFCWGACALTPQAAEAALAAAEQQVAALVQASRDSALAQEDQMVALQKVGAREHAGCTICVCSCARACAFAAPKLRLLVFVWFGCAFCVFASVDACMCARVHAHMCVSACACVCVCMHEPDWVRVSAQACQGAHTCVRAPS